MCKRCSAQRCAILHCCNFSLFRITQRLLGWEEICAHVSQFACTSLGKERLKHIDIPSTYDETHLLQSETKAAFSFLFVCFANINLGRVASDLVQTALFRANKGGLVDSTGLYSILRMLIVAQVQCSHASNSEPPQGYFAQSSDMVSEFSVVGVSPSRDFDALACAT